MIMPKSYFVAYPKKLNNLYITMTKQLNLKLFLTILISMVGVNAFSYDALIDGIYYNFNGDEAIVTYREDNGNNKTAYQGNVIIPSSVNYNSKDYSVTSIGNNAFYDCSGLTSIEIPNSVTSIGSGAFNGCSSLTSIAIPNSVTSIGNNAFNWCSGLTSVTIPNSVTSIGNNAFYDCSGLTSIEIPNSVTSIGNGAFYGCSGLTSIIVDSNNTKYDSRENCNAIIEKETNKLIAGCMNTHIPNSVTSIGLFAFSGCSGLTSIEIPNSVTSIGNGVFTRCSGLTSIHVDDNNPKYDSRNNCNAIIEKETNKLIAGCMNTHIPNSVTSIVNYAFNGCSGLTSIEIPNSVTSISAYAFNGCSGLTSIEIPNSVTSIGGGAFNGCSGLTSVKVYAKTPIAITFGTFPTSHQAMTLYVPRGSKAAYKTAYRWKDFSSFVEFDEPFTLTANNLEMIYGDVLPEFTYTSEGGTFGGTPQFTCEATSTSPVGTYPIVVSKGTIDNELGTYVNGTLTVTKAPLTITAKSYTIKQGEALPTFEAEYAGFKNSETSSVLTTQPTITTSATSASAPGTYDIIVSGAVAGNYDITYVKGTLTITQADAVTVTAKSYSRQYGEANPAFEYTSSGATLSGTPSITCAATVTSPVGEYDIVASKGTVTNYNVTYVNGKLTITKAPLTITAKSYSIKQGEALPAFEAEYAGFKNSETSNVLTTQPTITTSATSASEPGTYDIIISGASATNYDITHVKGTLTITQADAVTVTAKSYSRQYGEANPAFEYTSSGAALSGTPSISCEATATSPVGEYPIVITKGSVTNYNDTYVNGTLTVTKAPLTITAKSYTIKQGEALPAFEAEYSGFKNSETASVLTTQPTITTSATSASAPGTYDIIVSGAVAGNYDITYVKGTLTITQADAVTVTAKSYSRQYGESNPSFEYTSSGAALSGTPNITCAATATSPVGDYPIVITKGSVTNYNDSYVNGTLTVTKAPLTITAKSYSIKQGEALPAFETEYAGFKNSETASVLTTQPTITTTATSASAPGTYDIIVSGAVAGNYDITYVKGTLTITQADAVTVTAKSYSRQYGEANPAFEYTSSGAALSGTPSISCEATATSPVGEYPIVITKGSVTNYNDSYVNGTLTVTKAPLTITAKSYTIKQGEALPTFEAEYTGFKNSETSSVLTTQPTITTSATSASEPGTYDIVVSDASATNYDIIYVKGTLTITPNSTGILEISADNPVDVYNMQGNKVRSKATTLSNLPKGIYIVNGRKVIVK